jgi:hypothetical protein
MPTQYEISINPTSAKGDILSHDGASRIRIATGTSGQILTASSSAGLLWKTFNAASTDTTVALIANVTTTTALSTYTISSIPQTYQDLKLFMTGVGPTEGNDIRVSLESTGIAGGHQFIYVRQGADAAVEVTYDSSQNHFQFQYGANYLTGGFNDIDIFDYASTDRFKTVHYRSGNYYPGGYFRNTYASGYRSNTAAVSALTISASAGNLTSGARFILYGIKRSS